MPKAQIITEGSVIRLKQNILEEIGRLDAELAAFDDEAKQEREHRHLEFALKNISNKRMVCEAVRETYHLCLCEIQRNITEIVI